MAYPYLKSMCGASASRTFWRASETCSVRNLPCALVAKAPYLACPLLAEGWRESGAAVMDVGNQHPPGPTGFQKSEDRRDRRFPRSTDAPSRWRGEQKLGCVLELRPARKAVRKTRERNQTKKALAGIQLPHLGRSREKG